MTRCTRFEDEGLALLEAGRELDEHFAVCADCRAARAAYERLGQALAAAGAELAPPPGWTARVWARLDERRERRRRGWLLAPAAALAAAALAAVLWVVPSRPPPAGLRLEVAVESASGRRGLEAQPGDRLVLRAAAGGRPHAELRVYRNDRELVLRCAGEPPCRRRGDTLEAVVELAAPGAYQSLLLAADAPLPPPAGTLDDDAGAALDAGADVAMGDEVDVR
ncbi:MAG TPA: hypothetical protein VGG06_04475 [Thermoanaerobaculia bacterium]